MSLSENAIHQHDNYHLLAKHYFLIYVFCVAPPGPSSGCLTDISKQGHSRNSFVRCASSVVQNVKITRESSGCDVDCHELNA